MRHSKKLATAVLGAAATLPFIGIGAAAAADGSTMANLRPVALNGVKADGTAMVKVSGNRIDVTMAASGLLKDSPHAAHIHFGADARHECPMASDDAKKDGTLNTTDGAAAYGPIVVSLTKMGDTSPKSGLAIDRFSTAPGGKINYERGSIRVSSDVATAIADGKAVVVVHGVDHNDNGKYDGTTKSDLDPSLPAEATDPAICGVLRAAPVGGAATGGGGTATPADSTPLIALGGVLLLAAAGTGTLAARRTRTDAQA